MLYICEGNLRTNLVTKIPEHVTVKVFGIVNCDLLWDSVTTNNVLLEKKFNGHGGYVGDGLRLDPFHEIFYCHNGEGVFTLRVGEFANNVNAPPLQRPRWGDQLRRLC
jgi:hypothetical protein